MNKKNLQIVESEMALLTAAKKTALKDIDSSIKSAQEQLEQRRNHLVNRVLDQYDVRQKVLVDKHEEIKETNRVLNDNISQAKRITTIAHLNKLKPVGESLKKVNEKTKSISSNLDLGENYLVFDSSEGLDEFNKCVHGLGQVNIEGFLPSMITFKGVDAKAGCEAVLAADICNYQGGTLSSISPGRLAIQVTDPTNTELGTLIYTNCSECTVTFTPQMSGLHNVSGLFLGQMLLSEQPHISVNSNNPVLTFGGKGGGDGTFSTPWGICIDGCSCIYVADVDNKVIQKFTADGDFLSQFCVAIDGKDNTMCDIALDVNRGLILGPRIVDLGETCLPTSEIQVFNLKGELQRLYTPGEDHRAFSIAIDGQSDLILSNLGKKCLFKVDKDGNFVSSMGHLVSPGFIAIDDDGTIIVPDEDNDCIFTFNTNGTVRLKFGSSGAGKGQLKKPRGVAADGEYILVSEVENHRVQVFKYDGTFVSMIESIEDPLKEPCGLVLTTDGYVYVVDTGHNCIKKYKYRSMT